MPVLPNNLRPQTTPLQTKLVCGPKVNRRFIKLLVILWSNLETEL